MFSPFVTLWKFSRPHAFIGTITGILGVYCIALSQTSWSWGAIGHLAWTLLSCLPAAVLIVGVNQYYDVALDRINKPYLPMASGELSRRNAQFVLFVLAIVAVTVAAIGGPWLLAMVLTCIVIGIAYSVPPLRLKRSPLAAASCILLVRAFLIPLGLYLHFQHVLGLAEGIPSIVWGVVGFTALFSIAIALMKDIPDVEGDQQHDQRTFVMLAGPNGVFRLGLGCISGGLLVLGISAVSEAVHTHAPTVVVGQLVFLGLLLARGARVDVTEKRSITGFYLRVWDVFQLNYLLIGVAALTAAQGA